MFPSDGGLYQANGYLATRHIDPMALGYNCGKGGGIGLLDGWAG